MGQMAVLRANEVIVKAEEAGTGTRCGSGRFKFSGSGGVSMSMLRRRVVSPVSRFFRMRLRCATSGDSRLACLSHLIDDEPK